MSVESQLPYWMDGAARKLGVRVFDRVTRVELQGRKIDDELLARFEALSSLKTVSLHQTSVTDAGLARFRRAQPKCEIRRDQNRPLAPILANISG